MRTVKEFKDAGLVFVDGDMARDALGWLELGDMHLNQRSICFGLYDNDVCIEFAWRTNTGEKPSFSGMVELMDGDHNTGIKFSGDVRWEMQAQAGDANIYKWRPVISKESKLNEKPSATEDEKKLEAYKIWENKHKPTYTKEIHEAGELPPIGSKFMLAKKANCQRIDQFQGVECEVIGKCKSKAGCDVIVFSNPLHGFACMNHLPELIKPIDTRTDEEKLIDEAVISLTKNGRPLDLSETEIVERMIKAGYRKP